jgi:hypothetical protein
VLQTILDFVLEYAPYFYYLPESGMVDSEWGRGPAPASSAIAFLSEAYHTKQFEARKNEIYSKIVELAEYLLSIQCVDAGKWAYRGFKSRDDSIYYYSIDAMRSIVALLQAYDLTGNMAYFEAARLAGEVFLYNMQHQPAILGLHDKYYGGFAQAVTINNDWLVDMHIIDLYSVIGLQDLHVRTNEEKYLLMIRDALNFYRNGFEELYLKYSPQPYGDNQWHRTGIEDNLIYDDDFSYALHALFQYEGWSSTVKKVYEYINSIGSSSEHPNYNPAVCWAGYVDIVNRKPACEYYDVVTAGILYEIRHTHDTLALEQSVNTILSKPEKTLYWGLKFSDFTPIEPKQSIVTAAWIGRLLLNYSPLSTAFVRVLRAYGENIQLYTRRELNGTITYSEPATIKALINPAQANEIIIEPGYASYDYINIYTVSPITYRDKIVWNNKYYEVGPVEGFHFNQQLIYRRALCRRLNQ